MKTLLSIVFATLVSSQAFSYSEVPSCWMEKDLLVQDATFQLRIDTDELSREHLLALMIEVRSTYIKPVGFPELLGNDLVVTLRAENAGTREFKLPRGEFQKVVEHEIYLLAQGFAAEVRCLEHEEISSRLLIRVPNLQIDDKDLRNSHNLPQRFSGVVEFDPENLQ